MVARIEERCADIQHAQLVEMLRRKVCLVVVCVLISVCALQEHV